MKTGPDARKRFERSETFPEMVQALIVLNEELERLQSARVVPASDVNRVEAALVAAQNFIFKAKKLL